MSTNATSIFKVTRKTLPFGFESTWRYRCEHKQKQFDEVNAGSCMESEPLTKDRAFMSQFDKLKQWRRIATDPYNIEIPSIKVTNKTALLKDFKKLSLIMAKKGYIESSRSINNNFEGGGHIHVDYSEIFGDLGYNNHYSVADTYRFLYMPICLDYQMHNDNKKLANETFALLVENVTNYIINNPWVPWAFNAPNDNECGKNNILNTRLKTDIARIRAIGLQECSKFRIDMKEYAVVVRPELGTFEYRFFGMPKDAYELDLHINVAQGMVKHCLKLTLEGKKIERKYHNWRELTQISYKKSLGGLRVFCKEMNLKYSDLVKTGKINNLAIRYAYHKAVTTTKKILKKNMVLN